MTFIDARHIDQSTIMRAFSSQLKQHHFLQILCIFLDQSKLYHQITRCRPVILIISALKAFSSSFADVEIDWKDAMRIGTSGGRFKE